MIRHIQRGTITGVASTTSYEVSLSGFTNVDKMIVLLNGTLFYYNSASNEYIPIVSSITTDKLAVTIKAYEGASWATTCSYQVIEFY